MTLRFPFPNDPDRDFDVVSFGTNAVDHLITVPRYPEFDSKIELTETQLLPGGEAASTAVGLARLGLRVSYVGSFGDDAEGEIGRRSMIDENVDISRSRTVTGARTQIAYIIVDATNGERTVIWKRDRELSFSVDDAPIDLIGRTRLLHVTPHDIEAAIALAKAAADHGTVVSIDADRVTSGLDELLHYVDVCIISPELLEQITGETETVAGLRTAARRIGCRLIGVTRGSHGSVILFEDTIITTPSFPVPGGCIDTTGAGDAFRTGLLFGLMTDGSVERSAIYANAVAALKCRMPGARLGLPDQKDLMLFCKKQ